MDVNQDYVSWLVNFIKNGTVNIKTDKPFVLEDIKVQEYKDAVQAQLTTE